MINPRSTSHKILQIQQKQHENTSPKLKPSDNKKPASSFAIKKVKKHQSSSSPNLKQQKKQKKSEEKEKVIKKLASIPFKKVSKCPKPTLLRMDDNEYIIFITDHSSDKQCLSYDIKRETYFELCEYPELKFTSPSYSASPDGKHIYIYDGELQSFAMLDVDVNTNDIFNHPKVSNIKKCTRKHEKVRNLVKTGKGLLSIYLPTPWNEFHIIGGKSNIQHLKWSTSKKEFVEVSETASIISAEKEKGLLTNDIFFSTKLKGFILLGGNNDSDLISTLTYSSKKDKSAGFWWFKSVLKLPYKRMNGFGSIIYKEQYILIFGGNAIISKGQKQFKLTGDIFILDIERNKWRKSQICCPRPGTYYAIYVEQTRNIHVFSREFINNELKHWCININAILKQQVDEEKKMDEEMYMNNDNDIDGDGMDDHGVECDNLSIQKLQSDITKIWDVVNELKNEMEIIKEYQLEIVTNTEQSSLKLLDHHIKIINEINKLKEHNNNDKDKDNDNDNNKIEIKNMINDVEENKDDDDDETKEDIEEVKSWLIDTVGFGKYVDIFILNGFKSMDLIKEINDKNDLNNMGIKTYAHQIKIMNEINKLKDIYIDDVNNNDDIQDDGQQINTPNGINTNNPFYQHIENQTNTKTTNPFHE